MKICIYGAGAVGGYIGAKLSLAGIDVTLVARGAQLKAIQSNGLSLITDKKEFNVRPLALENTKECEVQDYVFITLKAHSVPTVLTSLKYLIGPQTSVIWAANGVPWWYFYNISGPYNNTKLETLDPGNHQWDTIGPEKIIASVIYPAVEVIEPGKIKHIEGNRISLGEPNGHKSDRVAKLASLLLTAGIRAPIRSRIRDELWVKLWGNLSFNPVSVLTGATLQEICSDSQLRTLIQNMMLEAKTIGTKLGVKFPVTIDKRIEAGGAVGSHKTSMLQDFERGRPMEIDALIGSISEMGKLTGTDTPFINIVLAMLQMKAKTSLHK